MPSWAGAYCTAAAASAAEVAVAPCAAAGGLQMTEAAVLGDPELANQGVDHRRQKLAAGEVVAGQVLTPVHHSLAALRKLRRRQLRLALPQSGLAQLPCLPWLPDLRWPLKGCCVGGGVRKVWVSNISTFLTVTLEACRDYECAIARKDAVYARQWQRYLAAACNNRIEMVVAS